ncbi:PDZ domain-containing protein [Niabella insulamsoli]|uniref:PDZ domain-containing protein n=1 Tax=Niabella insulamsoli TaxID=3144874 RepID=UPI0031FD40D1
MKKILIGAALALPFLLNAQEQQADKNIERIIITKKDGADEKLNIVVDGDKIMLNGKPLEEGENGDVTVKRLKIKDLNTFNWSPEVGNAGQNFNMMFDRSPNKAMLGVTTDKSDEGAKVMNVAKETAAEKAGLKEGDIITAVDGNAISTPSELSDALKDKKPGDKASITFLRDGKSHTVTATLTKWTAPAMIWRGNGNMNHSAPEIDLEELMSRIPRNFENRGNNFSFRYGLPAGGPTLGIKIQDVEKGDGVKIIGVDKGSDADKAGLKEGDLIKEANGNAIKGTNDLLAEKRKAEAGDTLKLKVERNGRPQTIDVTLSKKIKTAEL